MGRRRTHAPRRGSMGFRPRVRARSIVASTRSWPQVPGEPRLLGFAGYKVGMTHAALLDERPHSPFYGHEVVHAATVIECPPIIVCGLRAYESTPYGLKSLCEVWVDHLPQYIDRIFTIPKGPHMERQMATLESLAYRLSDVRAIVCTQPMKSGGLSKKKPEAFEVGIGCMNAEAKLSFIMGLLGKEVGVSEVLKQGEYVDVISVTKGKGYQGVVKRFGVKILPRWHKHRKGYRKVGAIGPQHPAVMFTLPRGGQMGFHQRTEYNKLILKVGSEGEGITPPGGFKHYGVVESDFIVVKGSVPGVQKRLVRIRYPMRPPKGEPERYRLLYLDTVGFLSK